MGGDRYVAFLRAINTGNRRLTNDQLLSPFRELGYTDVAAYQAAGNVTFRCGDPSAVTEERIDAVVAEAYGFDAPTFIRTAAELRSVIATRPFSTDDLARRAGKVQVTFLRTEPSADILCRVAELVPDEDLVCVIGRESYWLPVAGVSTSQLPVKAIEALLGEMTMRTLGTLERISAKYAD